MRIYGLVEIMLILLYISIIHNNYFAITGCPASAATVAGVCGP